MVTGIEATGVALAILPLVVNQLDNYARGLEKIKAFRRYKWQLEDYSTGLSAQYAILLNTLELSLEGVVDDHDQRSELISNPRGPGWKDTAFQSRFQEKLDREYIAFNGIVKGLCGLLEDLSHKLGLETTDYSTAASTISLKAIRFRKIFSSAIYDDILDKIDKTNQILKTLCEQSQHREQSRRGPTRRKINLNQHRDKRRHARSLYGIMVEGGQCWKCSCQGGHSIGLQLDTASLHGAKDPYHVSIETTFRMILSSNVRKRWHEVKVEADKSAETPRVAIDPQSSSWKSKVHFTDSKTKCEEAHKLPTRPRGTPISSLCSTFEQVDMTHPHTKSDSVGYILSEQATTDARYYMSVMHSIREEIHLRSLQDTLIGSPSLPGSPIQRSDELSRRDRLYLATLLACSVLQLHGTWLHQKWRTRDILFIRYPESQHSQFDRPYLLQSVLSEPRTELNGSASEVYEGLNGRQISNKILFPLALALIELSLGRAISTLHGPEDRGLSEEVSLFNTATRLLKTVYWESGSNYGDVVNECLYWSRSKGDGFEDPHFDESVFDTIVSPLLKDFDYFEGLSLGT
ncbi:uncharacterized protein N7479_011419 [Penicillium vulpinum]|uniref:DUF7580 domain-containing protein n=1 Tax=Penicillium vulpinum TaxID=29845 RepID=A0A1V6RXZ1_9EURO|nr:uncharacterized protein N7479_011419 [Penicillium vulpinum]KAJ5953006.1 hypothetical protein N7479_011419 [Penicillium vulpinum]OQE06448.1 hypothetical protein PENVUL_c018G00575 [Penicillium vulpinum]